MPPKRASKKLPSAPADSCRVPLPDTEDEGGEGEVDMVQELRVMEENLRQSVAVHAGIRKEQKQRRLEKEFGAQVSNLKAQIDEKVRAYRENVRQNQNTYLDRLTTLLQRKAEVERQLVRHTQDLAELCTTATEEFEAVIKGRSDDVDGAIEDLESVVTDAEGGKQQARDHSS